jgi:protein-tyrosine phosphatase
LIDIHSHILPGVDDGARTMEEAIAMLKMAVADGVTTQVLTPHIHIGRFNNTLATLAKQFFNFRSRLRAEGIPITLKLSAELRIGPEIMPIINNQQIPWLGSDNGVKTLLLEFPPREVPFGSEHLIRWLQKKNIRPVIAHPERNREFQQHPEKLEPFIDIGCPLQVTASSLTGRFGQGPQKLAIRLLKEGKVDVIASDCHNLKSRPPNLSEGLREAAKIVGESAANAMVHELPRQLITNHHKQNSMGSVRDLPI